MKNKHFIRIVAIALAIIMLLSVVFIALDALVPSAGARVTQEQINKLRDEKKEYERQKREIQSKINTIEFERMAELAKKRVLDDRIMLTGMEIDNVNEIIEYYVQLISEKEFEVKEAQGREDAQFQKYKNRVRDMEENGVISYLEIIFDSTSFSDLLARIDFVGDIMRADEKTYDKLTEARNETEAAKEALEVTKEEMEQEKVYLLQKEEELFEQLEEATALIVKIEANLEAERALHAEVIAEGDRIQKEINAKLEEQRREEERLRQQRLQNQASNSSVKGTGELIWPTGGSITSWFGIRKHPVFGTMRQHNGIDIGAVHGANVVAADAGTVITSTYNSSYGNYIVISHGNGMTTLYAHLSTRSVSANTSVGRGQLIGLVGSTGISTGPHLHFEVSVNGSRINPVLKLP